MNLDDDDRFACAIVKDARVRASLTIVDPLVVEEVHVRIPTNLLVAGGQL